LGIFGWKKSDDNNEKKPEGSPAPNAFSPEKAEGFFKHARTVHDTNSYEYAMQLWLSGMRQDPTSMAGLKGFFGSAASFLSKAGDKPRISKDVTKPISSSSPVDRYLMSLLDWSLRPEDPSAAVRAAELGAALTLKEPIEWIGVRAFNLMVKDQKRASKSLFMKLKEAANKAGAYTLALQSAEMALRMDPTDGELAAEIRNLAAQETMNKGGFENTGQAGGFRSNIKNADQQRLLEAQDAISKTADTLDLLVKAAEDDYANRPTDIAATQVLVKRLRERGRDEDIKRALKLMDDGYALTKQFSFREEAGELRLKTARKEIESLKERHAARPADAAIKTKLEKAERDYVEYEIGELKLREEAYPTDLRRKFNLGEAYYKIGMVEDSIALFQKSQSDPRLKSSSSLYLGRAFFKMGWIDETIVTFRGALEGRDLLPEMVLDIRYELMLALKEKAAQERNLASAEEAEKIASSIAIQQITYKDIRQQRDELKKLIAELRSGGTAPSAPPASSEA
jgi:hypothetical protein